MINQKKKKVFLIALGIIIFAFFSFFSLRKIFFTSGVLGHNWDWWVPALSSQLKKVANSSFFVWDENSLGSYKYTHNANLFFLLFGGFGYLNLSGAFVSKLSLFLTILISGLTMFLLLIDIFKENSKNINFNLQFVSAVFGGLIYALSPYIFNDFIGGAGTQFFTYAFLPLTFFLFRQIKKSNYPAVFILLLVLNLTIISFSIQNIFLISIILCFYPLIFDNFLKSYKFLFKVYLLFALFNFYWILPLLMGGINSGLSYGREGIYLPSIINNTPFLYDAFVGLGYFRDFFKRILSVSHYLIIWYITSFLLLGASLFSLSFFKKIRIKEISFWLILFFISLVFSVGGKDPFGNFILWLYKNFSLMALFSSQQHLLVVTAFSLAVLLGLGIFSLLVELKSKNQLLFLSSLAIITLSIMIRFFPFMNGNLGLNYLSGDKGGNYLAAYNLSPGFQKILEIFDKSINKYRVLPLPATHSPYFLKTEYQDEAQGGDSNLSYSKIPFLLSDTPVKKGLGLVLEKIFYSKDYPMGISKILALANVKYLLLRGDVLPLFGDLADIWNYQEIFKTLEEKKELKLVGKEDYVSLWENQESLPLFYIPEYSVLVENNVETIPEIYSLNEFPLATVHFFKNEKLKNDLRPKVDINPNEVFIEAKLKNAINEKELFKNYPDLERIFFPFSHWGPQSPFYKIVLKNEKLEEKRLGKDKKELIERKLFFASKRISEIENFFSDFKLVNKENLEKIINLYQEKMIEVIDLLEEIKEENLDDFYSVFAKVEITFQAQKDKVNNFLIIRDNFNQTFEFLNKEIEKIKIQHNPSYFTYDFLVPEDGSYSLYLQDLNLAEDDWQLSFDQEILTKKEIKNKENGWLNFGFKNIKKGDYHLNFSQFDTENLIEEKWKNFDSEIIKGKIYSSFPEKILRNRKIVYFQEIKNYIPETIYQLNFEYTIQNGRLGFLIIQDSDKINGQIYPFLEKSFPLTNKDSFEKIEIFFKSSPWASSAKILLFVDLKGEIRPDFKIINPSLKKVAQPKVVLKMTTKKDGLKIEENPRLTFSKINPTKYKVKVENASRPYFLVFSESFHDGWRAYVTDTNINDSKNKETTTNYLSGQIKEGIYKNFFFNKNTLETWNKKPIFNERHFLANGYANSWLIKPEDVGNQKDYEIIIEFYPQRIFYFGLIISLLSFFLTVLFVIFLSIKKV